MPRLVFTQAARSTLDEYNFEDYLSAISSLFEILANPAPDDVKKFAIGGGFPYQPGMTAFFADGWYIAYRVVNDGDVHISRIMRESDLPPRNPIA